MPALTKAERAEHAAFMAASAEALGKVREGARDYVELRKQEGAWNLDPLGLQEARQIILNVALSVCDQYVRELPYNAFDE